MQGIDEAYDQALHEYFYPYHSLVDLLVRVAVNQQNVTETVINLHAMVAYEGGCSAHAVLRQIVVSQVSLQN